MNGKDHLRSGLTDIPMEYVESRSDLIGYLEGGKPGLFSHLADDEQFLNQIDFGFIVDPETREEIPTQ